MITLQPLTIRFEVSEEFPLEDYLEYCKDYDITPSQKHYKKWATDYLVDSLLDDLDTSMFVYVYDECEKVDWKEDN